MRSYLNLLPRAALAGIGLLALASLPAEAQSSFAYAANSGSTSSISGYSVNPVTGALTPVPGSPFASGQDTNSIVIHQSGRFLYVTNENDNNVGAYTIDPATGALTQIAGSPFTSGIRPNSVIIHPNGLFLYTANETDKTVSVYSIGASGGLTQIAGSPFAVPGATGLTDSIAIDPSGRFAYVTDNAGPGQLIIFTVNAATGALAPIAASPIATGGDSTDWVVVHPSGRFVYAANFSTQTVSVFSINQATGALTAVLGSPFAVGGNPDQVNVDASGRFVFVANDGSIGPPGAGIFTVDPATGALTAVAGSPFTAGVSPSGVTPDSATRFLYVANENSNNVSVFAINPATGVLAEIAGSPFAAGVEPVKIALTPLPPAAGEYQIRYLANLDKGDSYVNLTNAGTLNGFDPAGRICVNVYTFDPAEELISCCACPVTPNGLNSLSARTDLISNTLTPGVPTSITVKLLATVPGAGNTCNASSASPLNLVRGMRAWATTLHLNTSGSPAVGFQQTETPFSFAELSATELAKLTSFCGFIQANGSGFGICKSCRAGALGAGQK